ncbi:hypothetical protein [Dyadobacter sp. 676]|uniref:Uncharacterized protein n=1 Tax=Dyadobacter sp. 676 TaxID=3088362 RepID=A0AAU8FS67_9BACT
MNTKTTSTQAPPGVLIHPIPGDIQDTIDDFFCHHPDPGETDMLLWRMFYHATLYDMDKNGVAAFFEDYGNLHGSLKILIYRLRALHSHNQDA